jgi:amino acid transporter
MTSLAPAAAAATGPARRLGVWHAMAVCVGMVVGAGIFATTPLAAANVSSNGMLLAVWVFGALMSLAGALCFAELAAAFPDAGGDYFFLRKAYGERVGFLFAWSRFAVIHTGSIALLAFTLGDYLAAVLPVGPSGSPLLAGAVIVLLTAVNLAGIRFGIGTQAVLLAFVIGGLLAVGAAGAKLALTGTPPPPVPAADVPAARIGTALVFVFLAYGGWSDAATLSAEMRDRERGMQRALVIGMTIVGALYVLVNWAFLRGLGLAGLAASDAPGAALMELAFGEPGRLAIVVVVAITAATSMNAIMIAGARTTYAAARDNPPLRALAGWEVVRGTPTGATLALACVALALVALGTYTRGGVATMVDYLSPVYWLFLTLSGVALFVLRRREARAPRPFRVPLYPWVPLAFVGSSAYVLYSTLAYVRVGALAGLAVLAIGAVLAVVVGRRLAGAERR